MAAAACTVAAIDSWAIDFHWLPECFCKLRQIAHGLLVGLRKSLSADGAHRSCPHADAHTGALPAKAVTALAFREIPSLFSELCGHRDTGVVLYQTEQFFIRVGLAQVVVDAQFDRMLAVLFGDARGDHDDRQV